jgi:hypothetical protein
MRGSKTMGVTAPRRQRGSQPAFPLGIRASGEGLQSTRRGGPDIRSPLRELGAGRLFRGVILWSVRGSVGAQKDTSTRR